MVEPTITPGPFKPGPAPVAPAPKGPRVLAYWNARIQAETPAPTPLRSNVWPTPANKTGTALRPFPLSMFSERVPLGQTLYGLPPLVLVTGETNNEAAWMLPPSSDG